MRVSVLILLAAWFTIVFTANAEPITVHETVVFDGHKGWEHDGVTYRLACAAYIAEMPNGDLLTWWLSGSDNEPSTDNNVLASRSTDKGKTWSEPYVLLAAGKHAVWFGPVWVEDGKVIAFCAEWPAEFQYTIWYYYRMESIDNGHTWSEREPVSLRPTNNIMMHRITRLQNGEYLVPACFYDKRTVPLTASLEALAHTKTEKEALALPPDPAIAANPPIFLTHQHGTSALITADPELRGLKEYGSIRNRPLGLLEGTAVQLNDGRIVMLMRAEWGGYLWRAESADNGRTWTDAWQTDIPNPTTLAYLLRLPDGRIALVHNATGAEPGHAGIRDPLSIWLSNDEMETWYIKEDVIIAHKQAQLSYPCPIAVDGKLVFTYDRDRRETRFVEVTLPPLPKP